MNELNTSATIEMDVEARGKPMAKAASGIFLYIDDGLVRVESTKAQQIKHLPSSTNIPALASPASVPTKQDISVQHLSQQFPESKTQGNRVASIDPAHLRVTKTLTRQG